MQRAVQDDLVPAAGQRRPAIRDGPHLVRARSFEPPRAERALTRRLVGPVLPPRGDNHPGSGQWVDPELWLAAGVHIRAGYALGAVLTSMLPLYATPLIRTTGAPADGSAGHASPIAETPGPASSTRTPGGTRISVHDLYESAVMVVSSDVNWAARRSSRPLPLYTTEVNLPGSVHRPALLIELFSAIANRPGFLPAPLATSNAGATAGRSAVRPSSSVVVLATSALLTRWSNSSSVSRCSAKAACRRCAAASRSALDASVPDAGARSGSPLPAWIIAISSMRYILIIPPAGENSVQQQYTVRQGFRARRAPAKPSLPGRCRARRSERRCWTS